jgi:DNA mismatch repair protein MutL
MSTIRILDSAVIDRIAAGEVVERPASVIKELVENALDAGATRIIVRLEDAGLSLIEVADDGGGMAAGDVPLAFAQHATSKVETVEDLDAIVTMGFRGEALASIASVSRIELITGTGDGPGTRLRMTGGENPVSESVAWPRGTTVRVADLFFNTPARRKNLKKPATELRAASQTVTDYALGCPDVHIELIHGKRALLAAPPAATLQERVHAVLGAEVAKHWLPVQGRSGSVGVTGGITSPALQRPHRNDIRWLVNGRPVADYRLAHALTSAYDSLLDARHFPVSVLFLELPVGAVDVNVHPRKAEVRFADAGGVYRAVRNAVREALARHLPPVTILPREERARGDSLTGAATRGGAVSSEAGDRQLGGRAAGPGSGGAAGSYPGGAPFSLRAPAGDAPQLPVPEWIVAQGTPYREAPTAESRGGAIRGTAGAIRPLAQYDNTYIVAADADGLLVIDQHVAHERVLYEQVLAQLAGRGIESQHLLVPETIELTAAEAAAVESHRELLEAMGFTLEPFGGTSWAVRSAPALLGNRDLADTVRALIETLEDGGGPDALDEARREMAASIACHAAVRANHPLTREEMVRLIGDLERCESPTRCPHGRPILLRIEHDELLRKIGRH